MKCLARAAGLAVCLSCPSLATAQPAGQPAPRTTPASRPAPRPAAAPASSRGFLSIEAGAQIGSTSFSESHTEPLNAEQKTWKADYTIKTAPQFGVGGGWRLFGNFYVAGAYSRFHDSSTAEVSAEIPHPFFFNQPRSITGESGALSHDENAVHISAMVLVPVGRRLEVGVFGGPSVISLSRELVKTVEYRETYPYDTATFTNATTESVSKTVTGFHAGANLTWLLTPQVGIGGLVRFTGASVDLAAPAGGDVSFDAGGVQAGVEVKFRFGARTSSRAPARRAPARRAPTRPGTNPPRSLTPEREPPEVQSGAIAVAVTTATTPIFIRPDATLTPLRQFQTGTRLRVLEQTADWLRVEFDDQQYGRRVGYVQKAFVRVGSDVKP